MKEFSTGASSTTKTKSFYKSIESLDNDMRKVAAEMGDDIIIIYAMNAKIGKNKKRETLYVGQSTQVSQRIAQHKMYLHAGAKTPAQKGFGKKSLRNAKSFRYQILKICSSNEEANKFEHHYIKALKPLLNDVDNNLGSFTRAKVDAAKNLFANKKTAIEVAAITGLSYSSAKCINRGLIDGNGDFSHNLNGCTEKDAGLLKAVYDLAIDHKHNGRHCGVRSSDAEMTALSNIANAYHRSLSTVQDFYKYLRVDWKLLFSFDDAVED